MHNFNEDCRLLSANNARKAFQILLNRLLCTNDNVNDKMNPLPNISDNDLPSVSLCVSERICVDDSLVKLILTFTLNYGNLNSLME